MSSIRIKQLTIQDWSQYKEIRLNSLKDSPDAFSSTYEEESKFSTERWKERVSVNARVKHALPLVAELENIAVGLACGIVHGSDDEIAKVYQMWVDPKYRDRGLGKQLLETIIDWAIGLKVKGLELDVTTTNQKAVRLYESMGFVSCEEFESLRAGSELMTQKMVVRFDENIV